jgi:hypothetical protein
VYLNFPISNFISLDTLISPGVTRQGREADYSSPCITEVTNGEAIPPLPNTSSWLGA